MVLSLMLDVGVVAMGVDSFFFESSLFFDSKVTVVLGRIVFVRHHIPYFPPKDRRILPVACGDFMVVSGLE
jgi:hypothetical protein